MRLLEKSSFGQRREGFYLALIFVTFYQEKVKLKYNALIHFISSYLSLRFVAHKDKK